VRMANDSEIEDYNGSNDDINNGSNNDINNGSDNGSDNGSNDDINNGSNNDINNGSNNDINNSSNNGSDDACPIRNRTTANNDQLLRIGAFNIYGLCEAAMVEMEMAMRTFELDILFLSETWLFENVHIAHSSEYIMLRGNCPSTAFYGHGHGGVAFLFHPRLKNSTRHVGGGRVGDNFLALLLLGTVLIVGAYISPSASQEWLDNLASVLLNLQQTYRKPLILLGDLNARMAARTGDRCLNLIGRWVDGLLSELEMDVYVDACGKSTCLANNGGESIVDYILSSVCLFKYTVHSEIVMAGSDHRLVTALLEVRNSRLPDACSTPLLCPRIRCKHLEKEWTQALFQRGLGQAISSSRFVATRRDDSMMQLESLTAELEEAIWDSLRRTNCIARRRPRNGRSWVWDGELDRLKQRRQELWTAWKNSGAGVERDRSILGEYRSGVRAFGNYITEKRNHALFSFSDELTYQPKNRRLRMVGTYLKRAKIEEQLSDSNVDSAELGREQG
jgi:hypothetical protein